MRDEIFTLKLSAPLYQAAQRLARERDETIGRVIRDALAAEIRRESHPAKTLNRADEQLLGPLQALLAADLASASGWADLDRRLRAKGYAFHEAGGGLALHAHPGGQRLCKASELGHSYSALMRRFGRPFPGHAHVQLARAALGPAWEEADPDLIEPFEVSPGGGGN